MDKLAKTLKVLAQQEATSDPGRKHFHTREGLDTEVPPAFIQNSTQNSTQNSDPHTEVTNSDESKK